MKKNKNEKEQEDQDKGEMNVWVMVTLMILYIYIYTLHIVLLFVDTGLEKILQDKKIKRRVMVVVFNATFNHISVTSLRPVLLVEETGVPGENHRPAASH